MNDAASLLLGFALLGLGVVLYFTPSIVAMVRHHRNAAPIVVLNFFGGWTFVGWVIALVWSFSAQSVQIDPASYLKPQA